MPWKIVLVSIALAAAPAASYAMCGADHAKQTAASCAPGAQWDAAKQQCVPEASS